MFCSSKIQSFKFRVRQISFSSNILFVKYFVLNCITHQYIVFKYLVHLCFVYLYIGYLISCSLNILIIKFLFIKGVVCPNILFINILFVKYQVFQILCSSNIPFIEYHVCQIFCSLLNCSRFINILFFKYLAHLCFVHQYIGYLISCSLISCT